MCLYPLWALTLLTSVYLLFLSKLPASTVACFLIFSLSNHIGDVTSSSTMLYTKMSPRRGKWHIWVYFKHWILPHRAENPEEYRHRQEGDSCHWDGRERWIWTVFAEHWLPIPAGGHHLFSVSEQLNHVYISDYAAWPCNSLKFLGHHYLWLQIPLLSGCWARRDCTFLRFHVENRSSSTTWGLHL